MLIETGRTVCTVRLKGTHKELMKTEKEPTIDILVFAPGENPEMRTIANELVAMQKLVGGYIECFSIGVEGLIGVCNDDFLFDGSERNRYNPATRSYICGTFFVAANVPPEFGSITKADALRVLSVLA